MKEKIIFAIVILIILGTTTRVTPILEQQTQGLVFFERKSAALPGISEDIV